MCWKCDDTTSRRQNKAIVWPHGPWNSRTLLKQYELFRVCHIIILALYFSNLLHKIAHWVIAWRLAICIGHRWVFWDLCRVCWTASRCVCRTSSWAIHEDLAIDNESRRTIRASRLQALPQRRLRLWVFVGFRRWMRKGAVKRTGFRRDLGSTWFNRLI